LKKHAFTAISILVILATLLGGCGGPGNQSSTPTGVSGTISTGKSVTVASTDIPAAGGSITVTDESSPVKGLEILVPASAYTTTTSFTISTAPIEKHTFGKDFNPITPLISIDNGGAYADEIMSVTIPVDIPEGYFAMGFYYDSKTGKLEGMATIAQDADSITIGTRHFSSFLVSMIKLTELTPDIDSGFRPGIDDWQFVNYGSYIEPEGHCAGQSLSALWYYVTQPDGKDLTLYNRYDNNGNEPDTPTLWQDDSYGYRFASTIQQDINWDGFAFKFWRAQRGFNDELTWNLFCYSMQMTGEPQLVGVTNEGHGGHAMICYRINDGKMYIADPNYPGDTERRIE
jgi:hypothetical protein